MSCLRKTYVLKYNNIDNDFKKRKMRTNLVSKLRHNDRHEHIDDVCVRRLSDVMNM